MSYQNFELALKFLFPSEGGYSNHKNDRGGPTKMGVTQSTYNFYRRKHGLPLKDVRYITVEESKKIYYEDYWLTSGADKISDPKMAILLFDTAVLHGPVRAKKFYNMSGGNIDKFLLIRRRSYDSIVLDDPSQKDFYDGWVNRVNNIRNYLNQINVDSSSEQAEVEMTPILQGHIETSDIEEAQKDAKLQEIENAFTDNEESDDEAYCPGVYPVKAYTKDDGTKVRAHERVCYKHGGKYNVPKLHTLPKEEMDEWIWKLV